jgi:undecaprenyl-diphosphatase
LGQAVALGVVHGPAELLPVSSSGHTTLIPWLLGSNYPELEPELRKALEVALHAGAAAGLLIGRPGELRRLDPMLIGVGSVPAGLAGLALERRIEASAGTPASIAAGLLLGGVALAVADRAPRRRRAEDATLRDALWLGVAQASALMPGVSRNGATLAAARLRRFRRGDAARLSRQLAWPVILGAVGLKGWRLRGEPGLRANAVELAAGALVSSISTLVAVRTTAERENEWPLLPYAIYRTALAILVLVRLRRSAGEAGPAWATAPRTKDMPFRCSRASSGDGSK